MKGAIAPFRTQIAKQKSKYRKEAARVGQWPALAKDLKSDIGMEGRGWDGSVAARAAGACARQGLCEVLWLHHAVRRRTGAGLRRRRIAALRPCQRASIFHAGTWTVHAWRGAC
ncbi:hypothetical protein CQA4T8M7_19480 [Sphaerotilus natans]|nr:hypothetical protein CQA4T8M7_19480 [Sphaerotilus natans]